jgi:hypothetical protein
MSERTVRIGATVMGYQQSKLPVIQRDSQVEVPDQADVTSTIHGRTSRENVLPDVAGPGNCKLVLRWR